DEQIVGTEISDVQGGDGHARVVGLAFEADNAQAEWVEPVVDFLEEIACLVGVARSFARIELAEQPAEHPGEAPAFDRNVDQNLPLGISACAILRIFHGWLTHRGPSGSGRELCSDSTDGR